MLEVHSRVTAASHAPSLLGAELASIALRGGARLLWRKGEQRVRFEGPEPIADDALLHPYLAPAAALLWMSAGAEALHGGVFDCGSGGVLLLGEPGAGKSSTLEWLASRRSVSVIADDLAVVIDGEVLAGPRCIDLRGNSWSRAVTVRDGTRRPCAR